MIIAVPRNILNNQPGPVTAGGGTGGDGGSGGDGGEGTPTGNGGDNAPTGPASITESGMNDDGATIYQIGPGQVFVRTAGDADTVWCRPRSDCNGEGGNRTAVNAASPPAAWIADASAVFPPVGITGHDGHLHGGRRAAHARLLDRRIAMPRQTDTTFEQRADSLLFTPRQQGLHGTGSPDRRDRHLRAGRHRRRTGVLMAIFGAIGAILPLIEKLIPDKDAREKATAELNRLDQAGELQVMLAADRGESI